MKFLIKKTPDNFIQSVNDEISSILNRNFDSFFPEYVYNDDAYKCAMPVEIDEKDKEYLVKAELPGVKKEDLDIDLEKNRLTISAKREEEHKERVPSRLYHEDQRLGTWSFTCQAYRGGIPSWQDLCPEVGSGEGYYI